MMKPSKSKRKFRNLVYKSLFSLLLLLPNTPIGSGSGSGNTLGIKIPIQVTIHNYST